jgi:hypothetical protein
MDLNGFLLSFIHQKVGALIVPLAIFGGSIEFEDYWCHIHCKKSNSRSGPFLKNLKQQP